jgi:hypothetical protein
VLLGFDCFDANAEETIILFVDGSDFIYSSY